MPSESQHEVIVVVDDEEAIRNSYADVLSARGYTVLMAENGDDALRIMTDHGAPVQLVISDINMPEMDGLEFVGLLRAAYPDLPALFVSGQSAQYMLENRDRFPEDVHFLSKPVSGADLAARVRQILDAAP
jgi:two-component system, cell cycle sensor histidine kinase and response regulator CckA